MASCAKCGSKIRGSRCAACGQDTPAAAAKAVNNALKKYSYVLLAGLLGMLVGTHFYPPLDSERLLGWSVCIFFLPIVSHIIVSARKRLALDAGWLRTLYIWSGGALLLLASCTIANGVLDKSPVQTVRTVVIRKAISSGRHSTTRIVRVPSWRPGRDEERLEVSRETYHSLTVGEPILVEVHAGLFGMPWYGRITPAG
jgi:hypothetical protein